MNERFQLQKTHELDVSTAEITALLAAAPIYAKTTLVKARKAIPGETIVTMLADGTTETFNTAGEDQHIITNPGGEEYIMGAEKFSARYDETDDAGVFRARGLARIAQNPTGVDIEIMAPWGEKQFGAADCLLATVYDPAYPDVIGDDRYIIGADEFIDTYGLYQNTTTA